jgi:hypothetical protein
VPNRRLNDNDMYLELESKATLFNRTKAETQ